MRRGLKVLISVLILIMVFSAGVLANEAWLKFTGGDDAQLIENNIEKIMEILKNVDGERSTAESLAQKLAVEITDKSATISKLEKTIQQLADQIEEIEENESESKKYVEHLEKELEKANKQVEDTREKSDNYLEEAKKYLKEAKKYN